MKDTSIYYLSVYTYVDLSKQGYKKQKENQTNTLHNEMIRERTAVGNQYVSLL